MSHDIKTHYIVRTSKTRLFGGINHLANQLILRFCKLCEFREGDLHPFYAQIKFVKFIIMVSHKLTNKNKEDTLYRRLIKSDEI